ncbi:putative disease resistance protein RGA1 [Musa acuminata AAA Group]|uniref:putative disease resistance protein RGA1 n=1 Tax=Musa acuminata AAA Group TaxID=214697 RepID=UPI0031D3AE6F
MSTALTIGGWFAQGFIQALLDKASDSAVQQLAKRGGLQDDLRKLQTILYTTSVMVDTADMRYEKNPNLRKLMKQLKDAAYDAEDLLDELECQALKQKIQHGGEQASDLFSVAFNMSGYDAGTKLREIQGNLSEITANMKNTMELLNLHDPGRRSNMKLPCRETSSFLTETRVYGRDRELEKVVELLSTSVEKSGPDINNLSVLPLLGIGGIGKTTLAQFVYNDATVRKHFELKIWVCVSDSFDVKRLTKEIIESVTNEKQSDLMNLDTLQVILKVKIASKRFLLVLDDVWSVDTHGLDEWPKLCAPLRFGAQGSMVMVTTRDLRIASIVGTMKEILLDGLEDDDYWELFKKCAFGSLNPEEHPELEAIGRKIAGKLKGSPLAAKTIGSLLRSNANKGYWRTTMESEVWELPQDENGVLSVLRLSYRYLPGHLKQCFTFCSLFPKAHEFYQDQLIQIWMAEGYITPEENKTVEDVGRSYVCELVNRSFFQASADGDYYVMHDLVHDLAQYISVEECYRISDGKSKRIRSMIRHLSAELTEGTKLMEFSGYEKLRTLMINCNRSRFLCWPRVESCLLPRDMLKRLRSIHVLVLQNCGLPELPETIGDLIHLRYLDVSYNAGIQRLPDALFGLYNLQALLLWDCQLQRLPKGMSNLINLRHLSASYEIVSEIYEVGKLTSLQELSAFRVLKDHGHRLAELKGLTQLHGTLRITNLENVESREEAAKAKLSNKEYIDALELEWASDDDGSSSDDNETPVEEGEILEGLQPHHALKCLRITGYNSARSPGWLKAQVLSNLESVILENCRTWEDLSCIGQLPNLKVLHIMGMPSVKKIGHELFSPQGRCFLRLEEVVLRDMPALEEWSWIEGRMLFPSLRKLEVRKCPKLLILPLLPPPLTELELRQVGLAQLSGSREGINGSGRTSVNPSDAEEELLSYHLPHINSIKISECGELLWLPVKRLKDLTSLEDLSILGCPKLMSTRRDEDIIDPLLPPSIKQLELTDCGNLGKSLPGCLHNLTSLTQLLIRDCPCVVSLPMEALLRLEQLEILTVMHCIELISIDGLGVLKSLQGLRISGCPKLLVNEAGDEQGEGLSLVDLEIDDTALLKLSPLRNTLPSIRNLTISSSAQAVMFDREEQELLRSFTDLKLLEFFSCKNLRSLPTELHALPSLQDLHVYYCPQIQSLPEMGLPTSLKNLQFDCCHPTLTEQLEKHLVKMKISGRFNGDY